MPAASQNRILQEKILFLNEKLVNTFEEISSMRKLHKKLIKFLRAISGKVRE